MEFDKKTILAFVLIGLILVLVNTDFYQRLVYGDLKSIAKTTATAQAAPDSSRRLEHHGLSEPSALVSTPGKPANDSLAAEKSKEREIVVETPLYRATFSTLGGNLRQWTVKKYTEHNKRPVDLIHPGADNLSILLPAAEDTLDLGLLNFECTGSSANLPAGGQQVLTFERQVSSNVRVRKSYRLSADSYVFGLSIEVSNIREVVEGYHYVLTWPAGLNSSERHLKDEMSDTKAYAYVGDELIDLDVAEDLYKVKEEKDRDISWVALRTKYFAAAVIPRTAPARAAHLSGMTTPAQDFDGTATRLKTYAMTVSMPLAGEETIKHDFDVYVGPLVYDNLKALGTNLQEMMNLGWGPIRPFSKIILWSLVALRQIIPNYGLVIIIFSILVKIILHPLTKKSYESMKQMQVLQPKMAELREKYGNDPQKLNTETLKMYQEHGVNPLGGCLPMVLQMPLLYALFVVFRSTIEFRQAPFFGWIQDLSAPDTIFTLPFTVPFYGNGVNVLPILMGVTMFIQQKMSVTDPKQKALVYLMPVMFTLIFNNLPSGLNLYYALFNIFSIIQQRWVSKQPVAPVVKDPKKKSALAQFRRFGVNAALSRKRMLKK
ncbi:MAG: membrane protein insertase YidC [bacterium]